jgi:hypothetical protein
MRFVSMMASMTDSMSSTEMRGQVMRRGFAAFDSIRSPGRGVEPPGAEEIAAKVAGGKLSLFDSRMGEAAVKVSRLIM